jgi:ankyrin repeat protein
MFNIIKFLFICVIVHASEVTQKELNKNLIQSIKANDLVLTKKLLDQGADINCANRLGDRPITLAIENQNLRLVMELLERGADVNAVDGNNRTPVMRAMECQNPQKKTAKLIFEYILNQGPDLTIADLDGNTAITDIAEASTSFYLELLLKRFDSEYLARIKDKAGCNLTDLILREHNSRKTQALCISPLFKKQVAESLISKIVNIAAHEGALSAQVIGSLAHGLDMFPEFAERESNRKKQCPEHDYYI